MSSQVRKSKFADLKVGSSSRSPANTVYKKNKEQKVIQKLSSYLSSKRKANEEIIRISLERFKENKGLRMNTYESQNTSGDNTDEFRLKSKRFSLFPTEINRVINGVEKQGGSPKSQLFLTNRVQTRSIKNLIRVQTPSLADTESLSNKLFEVRKTSEASAREQSPYNIFEGYPASQFRLRDKSPKNMILRSPIVQASNTKPQKQVPQSSLSNLLNFNDYFTYRTKNTDVSPKNKKPISISQKSGISFNKKSKENLHDCEMIEPQKFTFNKRPSATTSNDYRCSPIISSKSITDYVAESEVTEQPVSESLQKPAPIEALELPRNSRLSVNVGKRVSARQSELNKSTFSHFTKRNVDFSSYYVILDRMSVNRQNKLTNNPSLMQDDSERIDEQSNVSINPMSTNSNTILDEFMDLTGNSKNKKNISSTYLNFPISACPFKKSKICPVAPKPPYSYQYKKNAEYASYWMDCINKLSQSSNVMDVECTFYLAGQSSIDILPLSDDPNHPVLNMINKLTLDINREHNNHSSIYL